MTTFKQHPAARIRSLYLLTAFLAAASLTGCGSSSPKTGTTTPPPTTTPTVPLVKSTDPVADASGVPINRQISATFDQDMQDSTITTASFTLAGPSGTPVSGTVKVTPLNSIDRAIFTPDSALTPNTTYTAKLSTAIKSSAGRALANNFTWSFTSGASAAQGPQPVFLGTAGDYAILAKTAVSTTGATKVIGDVGVSPAAQSYLTGFSETLDATNQFATSPIVTGKMYAADMAVPTPAKLTTAISDMETAYTDAAGRTTPDFTELYAGNISGKTLKPGLYKWGTGVQLNTDVTLSGGANDVWIFQVAQDVTVASGVKVTLVGGALAKNIFWQVAGKVLLGTTADFKGVTLSKTQIVLQTGAVMNGRALAQTAVTLDANALTQPAQ